jgi:hypothetical protein
MVLTISWSESRHRSTPQPGATKYADRFRVDFNRFAKRAEAAIVTARQFLSAGVAALSTDSDSSSQSCAESRACSEPCNLVTAEMKENSSRSAN